MDREDQSGAGPSCPGKATGVLERAVSVPSSTGPRGDDAPAAAAAAEEPPRATGLPESVSSASSSASRRHSVTFTTAADPAGDPTLDRRRLQRTPTPYSEDAAAPGEDAGGDPAIKTGTTTNTTTTTATTTASSSSSSS